MAVKFQPVKIPQSGLSNIPVVNGQLIYCYDTGRVFVDTQVGRLQQGISTVSDSSSLPAIASDKLYFIKQSNKLVSFVNGAWKEVNSQEGTYLPLSGGTMTGGINSSASNVLQVLGKNIISQQKSGQYPAIAGDHIAYAGSQAEKGIVFKGKASANQNITDGLAIYIPFENQQTTAQTGQAITLSGNFSYGTTQGIPCVTFPYGAHMSVDASSVIQGSSDKTVSFWFYPTSSGGVILGLCCGRQDTTSFIRITDQYNYLGLEVGSNNDSLSTNQKTDPIARNAWHYVCLTIKPATDNVDKPIVNLFIDGKHLLTNIGPARPMTKTGKNYQLDIGWLANITGARYVGGVAALRIFNRVLNQDQITTLANQFTTQEVKEDGFLMQFTDSKYSFKPTSDKYDDSDSSNFWTGKAVKSYADSNYLPLTGGTLTGLLKLSQRPQLTAYAPVNLTNTTITTKADVTSLISQSTANYLPIAGGTMTGNITLSNTSMDLTNADTANIAVTGKAVTDYVDKKTKNYLPLSGGTVTGALTVNGTTAFGYRPSVTQTALSDTSNQYNLTTFKDLTTYVTNYTTKYLPLSGGVLTGPIQVIDGTNTSMTGDVLRWSYRITEANRCSLYSNVGTFHRQTSDSQTVTKYGRGVQLVPGFFDYKTRLGLYLTNYSSKASVSQIRKGIQITNTGTLTHAQDSTNTWEGFAGDASINFINARNTNSIVQWGPVTEFIQNKTNIYIYDMTSMSDTQQMNNVLSFDDIAYLVQPKSTTTRYVLNKPNTYTSHTHTRRLYVKLLAGYAFSVQGFVIWHTIPDFVPGYLYRLTFQWDPVSQKWLGNMFWSPQAIS